MVQIATLLTRSQGWAAGLSNIHLAPSVLGVTDVTSSCCGRSASYLRRTWKASPLCMHNFHSHYSLICLLFRQTPTEPSLCSRPSARPWRCRRKAWFFQLVDKASVPTFASCQHRQLLRAAPPSPTASPSPLHTLRVLPTVGLCGCWPCFHQDSWPPVWRQ